MSDDESAVVGSVSVSVVPDATNFASDAKRKLEAPAKEAGKSVGDAMAPSITDAVADAIAKGVTSAPTDAPAKRQGSSTAGSFADAFRRRLEAAFASLPKAEITADSSDADRKVAELRTELESLSKQKIGVDISDDEAKAKLEELRFQLLELSTSSKSISVKFNADQANAQLAAFADEFITKTEKAASDAGNSGGHLLGKAIATGVVAGLPLLSAAIAGVGAAGVIGIGAVIEKNAPAVQGAWGNLTRSLSAEMATVASPLVPAISGALGDAQRQLAALKPTLSSLFENAAPDVAIFEHGIADLVTNALPGFNRLVADSRPELQALSTVFGDVGDGVSAFFKNVSDAGPGAIAGVTSVGTAIEHLLGDAGSLISTISNDVGPILAELVPVLDGVTGALTKVAKVIPSGVLQAGATAWLTYWTATRGFSVLSTITTGLTAVAARLGITATETQADALTMATSAETATGAFSGLGAALASVAGPLGFAAGGLIAVHGQVTKLDGDLGKSSSGLGSWLQSVGIIANPLNTLNGLTGQSASAFGKNVDATNANALALRGLGPELSLAGDGLSSVAAQVVVLNTAYATLNGNLANTSAVDSAVDAIANISKSTVDASAGLSLSTNATIANQEAVSKNQETVNSAASAISQMIATQRKNGVSLTTAQASVKTYTDSLAKQIESTGVSKTATIAYLTQIGLIPAANQSATSAISGTNHVLGISESAFEAVAGKMGLSKTAADGLYKSLTNSLNPAIHSANGLAGISESTFETLAAKLGVSKTNADALYKSLSSLNGKRFTTNFELDAFDHVSSDEKKLSDSIAKSLGVPITGVGVLRKATGGVIPGYSPGHDTVPAMLSPGEGILTPQTTRALGGAPAIAALNATQHFANGGVVNALTSSDIGIPGVASTFTGINAAVGTGILGAVMKAAQAAGAAALVAGGTSASVGAWIATAMKDAHVSGPAWSRGLSIIIGHESSGNPNAVNLTDSNAKAGHPSQGLMQLIPGTFARYRNPALPDVITNPIANIVAGIDYILGRYGGINNVPGVRAVDSGRPYVGYASGALSAMSGTALVGEHGPELVKLRGGETIYTAPQTRAMLSRSTSSPTPTGSMLAAVAANGGTAANLSEALGSLSLSGKLEIPNGYVAEISDARIAVNNRAGHRAASAGRMR